MEENNPKPKKRGEQTPEGRARSRANLIPFKAGAEWRGNPGGSPKGKKLSTIFRDITDLTAKQLAKFRKRKDLTLREEIALSWADRLKAMPMQGGPALLNTALDRLEGAVTQTMSLKSPADRSSKTPAELAAIAAKCQKKPTTPPTE